MLTKVALLGIAVAVVAFAPLGPSDALAQSAASPTPSPSPSPKPSASPTQKPVTEKKPSRLSVSIDSYTSGTNQQFVGPGVNGAAEIPNFSAGGPLAPAAPYDFFSGAPTTTGQAISQDLIITPTYRLLKSIDVSASFGYGSIGGSGNVGAYWGDPLMATINPHLGSQAVSVPPFFATHNGQDAVNAARLSVLYGSIAMHNGTGGLSGGWFDLHQAVPFIFAQAPWTTTPTQLAPQIQHTIGDGPPAVDVIKADTGALPLHGYDLWAKLNTFTVEATNADLPAMAGTVARESSLSGVYQQDQVRISAEIAHLMQSGAASGRILFGASPTIALDGAAVVPYSTLLGQRMTIEGIGATFPIATGDADVKYGHSCYSADNVAVASSTCTPGNFFYAKYHQGFTKFDIAIEAVRFEAQYAPALLPYGTIENVWSAPFAMPSTWLKGDYQFVDNSQFGANRQGLRASTSFLFAGVETRLAIGRYVQVQPYDLNTGTQSGFVEPYFSPQLTTTQGVLGTETRANAYFAWHPAIADVSLELSDVITNRYAPAGRPQDSIAIDYPSIVVSASRQLGRTLYGVGWGRYGVEGSYDTVGVKNASLSQNVVFAGVQYRANANSAYALQYQLFSVNGSPVIPNGLSPAYHGPQIQFYQRLKT